MYKHALGRSKFSAFKRDRFQKTLPGSARDAKVPTVRAAEPDRKLEPSLEPTERDQDTLDAGRGDIESRSLFWSVIAQVELRERRRLARMKKVKAAEEFYAKQKVDRLAGKAPTRKYKQKGQKKKAAGR